MQTNCSHSSSPILFFKHNLSLSSLYFPFPSFLPCFYCQKLIRQFKWGRKYWAKQTQVIVSPAAMGGLATLKKIEMPRVLFPTTPGEGKGPQAKEWEWLLAQKGKETDSLLESPEELQASWHLDFNAVRLIWVWPPEL